MTNVILPRLLILFYLFISLSKALATPTAIYVSVEQEVLSNTGIDRHSAPGCSSAASSLGLTHSVLEPLVKPSADEFCKWLEANKSKRKNICFYSGETAKVPVFLNMPAFSNQFGCDYMGPLLEMAGVEDKVWKTWDDSDWTEVSKALARIARGEAIVILGKDVKPTSHWRVDEFPILKTLMGTGEVSKITGYRMKLGLSPLDFSKL
ncbi:hypothetical protein H1R20_g9616, partial [Candolleomyces eurysporus]